MRALDRFARAFRASPVVAGIVVSAITLLLVGGVVLTMTSVGCGPAHALGLSGISSRCSIGHATPVAALRTPSPSSGANPSAPPSPTPPAPVQASAPEPPVVYPGSGPQPPGSSAATPSYPIINAATGSGPPPVTINCRLPVYVGPPGSGGFIVFPGHTFIADPASGVTLPSPSPGAASPPPPIGPQYGQGTALTYDRPYSRWVPASASALSPDGKWYAFFSVNGIYVVNVASGSLAELGEGHAWFIVGVDRDAVYAMIANTAGLWRLPLSGAASELTTAGYWQAVGGGAAYGTATSAVPSGTSDTILRFDLASHATAAWFTQDGRTSRVIGFDGQGNPVVVANGPQSNETWIVTGPSSATPIALWVYQQYGGAAGLSLNGPAFADTYGVWFYGNYSYGYNNSISGIVLYVPGQALYVMSNLGVQLAGGC